MTAVSLSAISKSFGSVEVLKSINLDIDDGCFFTLLGPSGCGKTTLLRLLAGFAQPELGQIRFGDDDVTRQVPHKRNIGMVFQDYALFPDKTVFDNVAYGLRARGVAAGDIRRRVQEYLDRVDLNGLGDRSPAQLSGGQRQRVALARALVIAPRVLLMDEPLSNLDAKLRVQMRDFIRDLQHSSKITTVFVTHDQEEALALSDRIAVMRNGRIEQVGSPQEIYAAPQTAYVADFVGAANLLPAKVVSGTNRSKASGGRVVCDVLGREITGLNSGKGSLEDLTLVARPEEIEIRQVEKGSGSKSASNTLLGRVRASQYLGSRTAYTVVLNDDITITVDTPSFKHQTIIPDGTKVEISFSKRCLFVGDKP